MKKLSSILSENLSKPTISLLDIKSFDELFAKAEALNSSPEKLTVSFKQENVNGIDEDEMMKNYFKISDIVDAFSQVAKHYADERQQLSWHDEKIVKYLASIQKYINQLASYISIDHTTVQSIINLPPDALENKKSLATILKQSDEWKELRQLLKSDLTLKNQSLTVRGIGFSIINKTKSFTKIIN